MPRRLTGVFTAIALQGLALVLAHELVFLARYGSRYGEALVHAGHGEAWRAAVSTILVVAASLGGLAVLRLASLGILVRRRESLTGTSTGPAPLEARSLLRAWLRTAPRISLLAVAILTILATVERTAIGQP